MNILQTIKCKFGVHQWKESKWADKNGRCIESCMCAHCSKVNVLNENDHTWNEWQPIKGECKESRQCKRCAKSDTHPREHDWGEWQPVQDKCEEHRQCKRCAKSDIRSVMISGDWGKVFDERRQVQVYADSNRASAFFSQSTLPYLWPDLQAHRKEMDSRDDPQFAIRLRWIVAYLHHPDHQVIITILRNHISPEFLNTMAIADTIADLLIHSNAEVRSESAKVAWKCKDASMEIVFNILSSQGTLPSGVTPQEGKRAAETLRDYCPPERQQLFRQLALNAFGPSVAGVDSTAQLGDVSFKEKTRGGPGGISTYEVYTAKNKLDALSFLESKEVQEKQYYIVVKTPEGTWGKDCNGVYQE